MNTKKILNWIDSHAFLLLSSFLLAFIPLYPKLPLFDIIPGYLVRVRIEDFLVLITVLTWGIQVLRKKIDWRTPLTFAVILYAIAGLLSTISGVLITQTIPAEFLHIGKSLLHYFRYMEYFSLLFVVFAGIKDRKDLKVVLGVLSVTVLAISIYAIGQRFLYWPVYSTMNREFSKGIRLYLTEHARVQSTFGGHYDLAAYLVILTPILLAAFYLIKRRWIKIGLAIVLLLSHWTLISTASRASYMGFVVSAVVTVILLAFIKRKTWLKRILWTTGNLLIVGGLSLYMMLQFGESMYERFVQTLEAYPAAHDVYHETNRQRKELVTSIMAGELGQEISGIFGNLPKAKPPENGLSVEEAQVLVASDTRPTPKTPSDVYVDVPDLKKVATKSADGTETEIIIEQPREYSDAAQIYGLSAAIRLDTLWPRALQGFYTNPAFGTGYATLTKEAVGQFTEAESTDNNFLRTLGETGAFGFITFYGTVILAMYLAFRVYLDKNKDEITGAFMIGFIAASIGLLVNAIFIDVFAASKVAFTYWGITGIVAAMYVISNKKYFAFDFLHRAARKSAQKKKTTKSK